MNISCVICGDLFLPSSEIHSTTCGHMFHLPCLMNWLERSKSCPQCRNKVTEKSLHRIFFNLANTDACSADVGTLVNQVENLQFQLSLEKRNKKESQEKIRKLESMNRGLREEVAQLENQEKIHESAMHALMDKNTYFKTRAKEADRLSAEIVRLKNGMKDMDNVNIAINGTRDQVNEILRNEHNIESLALLAATLKKALLEVEKNKRDIEFRLKRAKNDASKYRRESSSLECEVADLRRQLQNLRTKYGKEKEYAKEKIAEIKLQADNTIEISDICFSADDDSVVCLESSSHKERVPINTSLPLSEKVQKILNSDSPYLPLKTNSTSMEYGTLLNEKHQTSSGTSVSSYTIFKTNASKHEEGKKVSRSDVCYNGLGGSGKDDIFPSPKPVQTGLKRNKSSTSISSKKFKKLTAVPSSRK